jgi:hypothetical protein
MESQLPELVAQMAAAPNDASRDAFYRGLASSQVYFPTKDTPPAEGRYVIQAGDNYTIPAVPGPAGEPMLMVFANPTALAAFHPNQPYAGIDGRVVLQIAKTSNHGVIVQSVHQGRASWAGVRSEDVANILEQVPSQGS